jgi:hypothetical protein
VSGSLRALTSDGELLTRVSATVPIQHPAHHRVPHEGFAALAERLAVQLADAVLAPFTATSLPPRKVTVQVQGARTYADVLRVKDYLQDVAGVRRLEQIQLQPTASSLTLVVEGDLSALSNLLATHDFGSFTTATEVTGDDLITLNIIGKR